MISDNRITEKFTLKVGKGGDAFVQDFTTEAPNGPSDLLKIVAEFRDLPIGAFFYWAKPSALLKKVGKRWAVTAVSGTPPFRVRRGKKVFPVSVSITTSAGAQRASDTPTRPTKAERKAAKKAEKKKSKQLKTDVKDLEEKLCGIFSRWSSHPEEAENLRSKWPTFGAHVLTPELRARLHREICDLATTYVANHPEGITGARPALEAVKFRWRSDKRPLDKTLYDMVL